MIKEKELTDELINTSTFDIKEFCMLSMPEPGSLQYELDKLVGTIISLNQEK